MITTLSLLFALLSVLGVVWFIAKLPADFFQRPRHHRHLIDPNRYPNLHFVYTMVRNILGLVLILAGIVMLVLPGQGVLTIIMGLIVADFPQKERWLRRLTASHTVKKGLNLIRRKFGKEEFHF